MGYKHFFLPLTWMASDFWRGFSPVVAWPPTRIISVPSVARTLDSVTNQHAGHVTLATISSTLFVSPSLCDLSHSPFAISNSSAPPPSHPSPGRPWPIRRIVPLTTDRLVTHSEGTPCVPRGKLNIGKPTSGPCASAHLTSRIQAAV